MVFVMISQLQVLVVLFPDPCFLQFLGSYVVCKAYAHLCCDIRWSGVSLIAGMEYGMECWNGKWNGTMNVHSYS